MRTTMRHNRCPLWNTPGGNGQPSAGHRAAAVHAANASRESGALRWASAASDYLASSSGVLPQGEQCPQWGGKTRERTPEKEA